MSDERKPKVVWVVGVGARTGLGAALAGRFAREGLIAAVTGRTEERLADVSAEIVAAGGKAVAFAGDVTDEAAVRAIAGKVRELGRLEVVIFNAGNAVRAPSLELSVQQLEDTWRVNALGGFIVAREALQAFMPHQQGSLLFTGATASLRGKPPFGAFASAKAALRSLSQTFAREFGPKGIHVAHVVIDGGIDGERLRQNASEWAKAAGADGLLSPDAIAETYWQLHCQPRNAWTQELELRPYKEVF